VFKRKRGNESHLEHQWELIEDHYINNKPIAVRIVEITNGFMLVDFNGIISRVENYTLSFTRELAREPLENELGQENILEQIIQQKMKEMKGKEILLRVVEVDKANRILKLSQHLYIANEKRPEEFDIGSIYNGIVASVNTVFITVNLGGVIGKLPSKQPVSDQTRFIDLSTLLHIGQEIEVIVIKRQKHSLLLSSKEFEC
jgi:ribosomal protein S1